MITVIVLNESERPEHFLEINSGKEWCTIINENAKSISAMN